jgi:hypothetical protein
MTSLLARFGMHSERFVTTDGRIVFSGVSATPSGAQVHDRFGHVTQVPSHTFHGGIAEPNDPDPEVVWWEDEVELARHTDAMALAFPAFTFMPAQDGMNPCWIGQIDTGRGAFSVAIIVRRDNGLPAARVLGGARLGAYEGRRWVNSPHLYLNGNLCIAAQDDWKAHEHTAATATLWAAHWLAAFTEWRISHRWPVDGVRLVA